jgi:NDP-sugar pyrophosphorylase family protein
MLPAMVLAAGLGTRLRPLTDACAKPLVPVGDRPALAHVLDRLRAAGVPRVVVNAHHHADQMRAYARAQVGLAVSEETELLGTAGGLARARELLGEGDILVWNGDILCDLDARALVAAHAAGRDREHGNDLGAQATLVVQPLPAGEGRVGMDAGGRVVRLRRERFGEESQGGEFLGIHVLGARLRAGLPRRGGLVEDVLVPALARGAVVRAWPFDGRWHDIGTVATYLAANLAWLEARGAASWVGPGARIASGVTVEQSVVGAGASVEGLGSLVRCVVWPGAQARAPLAARVVTS